MLEAASGRLLSRLRGTESGADHTTQRRKIPSYQTAGARTLSLKHENAVFVNAYHPGPQSQAKFNSVYKDYVAFGTAPARATIQVREEGPRAAVLEEVALIAVR